MGEEKHSKEIGRRTLRKVTLGGPGSRWEDSKMDFKESKEGTCGIDSTDSGWGQ